MSLFNRNKKLQQITREDNFSIFQFPKIEGLRTRKKEKYVPTEYLSPIFGQSVKDETVAPYVNKGTGDTTKQYDFLRTEPIGDSSKYDEFGGTMVTHDTRKELYGDVVIDKDRKYIDPKKVKPELEIPYTGKESEKTFVDIFQTNNEPIYEKPVIAEPVFTKEVEYELEEETPKREPAVHDVPAYEYTPIVPEEYEPERYQEIVEKPIDRAPKPTPPLRAEQPKTSNYNFPTINMFSKKDRDQNARPAWLIEQEETINKTLEEFNVSGKVKNIVKGPTVTRHEIELEPGVNVNRVSNIENNLKMNLAAVSTRIEAPIPGKPFVGLEVPNIEAEIVAFGNVISDPEFMNSKNPLMIALGVDIDGNNIFADIEKMPHGLIAGATNSGKSVCVNTIIMSLLIRNHPDDLKFILIDPKMVEMTAYNDIPHLATPVINDAKMASTALSWACQEMDNRFSDFAKVRARDLKSYNEKALENSSLKKKPYIVIIIDELADLMAVSSQDVEYSIKRLTSKARAAGIHLLVATQRPTTNVVSGNIKANIPTRIAFRVASFTDSVTILDSQGAEYLLGRGDMLYKPSSRPIRLQGAYVKDKEIDNVTDFIRDQMEPTYLINPEELKTFQVKKEVLDEDDLIIPVTEFVVREGSASINKITIEFGIGFNRAQRIMEILEEQGIVASNDGSTKARKVLVTPEEMGIE